VNEHNVKLENIEYYVVPVDRNQSSPYGGIQDKIFDFWSSQWTANFKKSNPKPGWQDHFLRMNLASAIGYQGQIIGCLLFKFYNLTAHSTKQSEYFSYIDRPVVQRLSDDGFKDAMSVEYLAIDPSWSKNPMKISLGKIIITLSAYVAETHDMDCIISMPIGGTKVDKMLENIGAVSIQEGIEKYGYTLKLMMTKTKPATKSIDSNIKIITDRLWRNRIDYSVENQSEKQAA
jgi:hypothetical protein